MPHKRSRPVYSLLVIGTIMLGLASRHFSYLLPSWAAKNTGDILYATMIFWIIGLVSPGISTNIAAIIAALFCSLIEFAKLNQSPWLVAARHHAVGRLVFGVGFHWANLFCYLIGVTLAVILEMLFSHLKKESKNQTR